VYVPPPAVWPALVEPPPLPLPDDDEQAASPPTAARTARLAPAARRLLAADLIGLTSADRRYTAVSIRSRIDSPNRFDRR